MDAPPVVDATEASLHHSIDGLDEDEQGNGWSFDCVGYGDSIQIYGGKSSPELWNIAKKIDSENDKLLVPESGEGGGADAEPFFQKGIKTLYSVSTNSYKHLHQMTDTPETINKDLLTAITKLGYKTAQFISANPLFLH